MHICVCVCVCLYIYIYTHKSFVSSLPADQESEAMSSAGAESQGFAVCQERRLIDVGMSVATESHEDKLLKS